MREETEAKGTKVTNSLMHLTNSKWCTRCTHLLIPVNWSKSLSHPADSSTITGSKVQVGTLWTREEGSWWQNVKQGDTFFSFICPCNCSTKCTKLNLNTTGSCLHKKKIMSLYKLSTFYRKARSLASQKKESFTFPPSFPPGNKSAWYKYRQCKCSKSEK
jgi:hypothetical protein